MSNWTKWEAVVTVPNEKNKAIINAYVYDFLPFTSGNILKITDKNGKIKLKDISGNDIEQEYISTSTIKAEYIKSNDNVSIPDVVPGERVEIWQYKKQGSYFWKSCGKDSELRMTEHYRIHASDKQKVLEVLTDDNTYYFEIDTTEKNKFVKISTSKSDEEEFRYVIKIDCLDNSIILADDDENRIYLNSKEEQIILENKSKSKVELSKKDILIYAPNDIKIQADNNIDIISKNTTTLQNKDAIIQTIKSFTSTATDITESASNNINISSGSSIGLTSPIININAATSYTVATPTISITAAAGDITVVNISHVGHKHLAGAPPGDTGPPKN